MLVYAAVLMAWSSGQSLLDRFTEARGCLDEMFSSRRRVGRTYQGFIKQLMLHGSVLLEMVHVQLRRRMQEIAGVHWLRDGFLAFAVDGSRIEMPRTFDNEEYFGCGGRDKTGPQMWLTTLWHIGTGLPWCWKIGKANDAERNHLRDMLKLLPQMALLIADAGFTGYELMTEILSQGHSFLIRVGSNVRLLTELGYAVVEHDGTVYLWPSQAMKDSRPPLVLRMIVLQRKGKKIFLLTNVDEEKLSDRQAGVFYEMRWGVEVFYRSLKQTLGHRKMLSRAPRQAKAELAWTMAGLQLLGLMSVERIVQAGRDPLSWSVAMSLRAVRTAMMRRYGGMRSKNMFDVLGECVKDEYVRKRPKKARDWPHKKRETPPGEPKIRRANEKELEKIKELKRKTNAA